MDNNTVVNLADTLLIVLAIEGNPSALPMQAADLAPCLPNRFINLADALETVLVIEGGGFFDSFCPMPCP